MIWLNGIQLEFETFPNGETKVNGELIQTALLKQLIDEMYIMQFKYEKDSDLIQLMFVKRHLDSITHNKSQLEIHYMPYSRMDRVEGYSVFTLKYMAEFINSLNFDNVIVFEPHSDVTTALLNNCHDYYLTSNILKKVVEQIGFDKDKDYLFFPDATAQKRYGKIKGFKQMVGFKKRDFETGKIEGLMVVGDVAPQKKGYKVIIVDDLCSYGGTFLLGAKKLKERGAGDVHLIVGHCEDSIYKGNLLDAKYGEEELITSVHTTDSIIQESLHDKVTIHENLVGV